MIWIKNSFQKNKLQMLIPFAISGLVVSFMLWRTPLMGDDLEAYHDFAKQASLPEMWGFVSERFFTWSSRTLVEFVLMIFEKMPKPVWALAMGISWAVLLWAISEFISFHGFEANLFLALLSLLVPFEIFGSAGWIATTHTYLTPITFGVVSLLPIREAFNWQSNESEIHEKKEPSLLKMIAYSLALIYAANLEQMAVVLVFAYGSTMLFEIVLKKINYFHAWMLFLSLVSLVIALVCPGNAARTISNITYWFPNYQMFTIVDKLEMGISTEASWLFREPNLFWIVISLVIMVSMYIKSRDVLYRLIGIMPFAVTVFFAGGVYGEGIVPQWWSELTGRVPRNGLISKTNLFSVSSFVQWMLFGIFYVSLVLAVWLLSENLYSALLREILLFGGFGSRWMMGFSPTIYASYYRTCLILIFILILIGASLWNELLSAISSKLVRIITYAIMSVLVIWNIVSWGSLML